MYRKIPGISGTYFTYDKRVYILIMKCTWVNLMVKMACDRLLALFMSVEAVTLQQCVHTYREMHIQMDKEGTGIRIEGQTDKEGTR